MKLAIFIRVSTNQQANSDSPETHERRARDYAIQNSHEIVRVFRLLGVSGKDTYNHPESEAMREMIRLKQIDGIIISSLSRLARNTRQLLEYNAFLEKHGASLISLKEHIATDNSSSSKFFFSLLSSLATWERDNALERMQASIETRRSQEGRFVAGNVSLGFKIENAIVVLDEETAPIRALIFDLFLEHRRYSTVARILNEEKGLRTSKGKKWSDITIKRLLKNTDAKGIRRSNYRGKKTEENPSGLKPSSEWIYSRCPQIVSEDKFDSVAAIIKEQESKSKQTKPLNQRVHIFTNLIFCPEGHKLSMTTKTNKYTCVQCKLRIDKDDLEEVFKSRIKQFIISDEEQIEYTKTSNQEIKLKEDEIIFTKKEIESLQKKMDNLITLSTEGQIPLKGFNSHYQPLFDRQKTLQDSISFLKKELEVKKETKSSQKLIFDKSKDLYENWDALERPEKRYIAQSVINKITFDGKTINFNLKKIAPLSSLELGANGQHSPTI